MLWRVSKNKGCCVMLKKLAIIFVALFGVLLAVPTMVPGVAKYFPSWIQPINLGLDLKGGAQLLLEVDTNQMFADKSVQLYDEVRSALVDRNRGIIKFANLRQSDGVVSLTVRENDEISKAKGRLKSVLGAGVDVSSSGNVVRVAYTDKQKQEMVNDALNRSIEIVRRRIDALGTKEPAIKDDFPFGK